MMNFLHIIILIAMAKANFGLGLYFSALKGGVNDKEL